MQHRLANLVHDYNNQATLPLSYATVSHTIAVISTDVENFHYINDKYGYPLGNEILNIVYDELAASSLTLFTTRIFSDVFISIADMERLSNDALLTQIQLLDKRIRHLSIRNLKSISSRRLHRAPEPSPVPKFLSAGYETDRCSGPLLFTFHCLNRMDSLSLLIITFTGKHSNGFRNIPIRFRNISKIGRAHV